MNKLWQNRLDGLRSTITNVSALSDGAARSGFRQRSAHEKHKQLFRRLDFYVMLPSCYSLQASPGSGS